MWAYDDPAYREKAVLVIMIGSQGSNTIGVGKKCTGQRLQRWKMRPWYKAPPSSHIRVMHDVET